VTVEHNVLVLVLVESSLFRRQTGIVSAWGHAPGEVVGGEGGFWGGVRGVFKGRAAIGEPARVSG